mmetsp:Transcript_20354/g.30106  ORF Transcript_20354/g.30106 Transcript_20354/m.30106 type:complete len:383 (-) Transcript_20354:288-1436(-)
MSDIDDGGSSTCAVRDIEENREIESSSVEVDKYFCHICFEERRLSDIETFQLQRCGHPFCQPCLTSYIAHKVAHGEVYPTCFIDVKGEGTPQSRSQDSSGEKICDCAIEDHEIEHLLANDPETSFKYQRFKMCKENSNLRFCSKCECPTVGDAESPLITCPICSHQYCFAHGDAHNATVTCMDHELALAEESHQTRDLLDKTTKPCPNCGSLIEKAGGCNQMKCTTCKIYFCWLCGKKVDDSTFPAHFEWWNVAGCPNRQMEDEPDQEEYRRLCVRIISVLQILILGPPAFALTIVSSIACCCFIPMIDDSLIQIFSACMTVWGYVVMAILLMPFIVAFGVPLALIMGFFWAVSVAYNRANEYVMSLKPAVGCQHRPPTPMP